jgi:hypothetical protein
MISHVRSIIYSSHICSYEVYRYKKCRFVRYVSLDVVEFYLTARRFYIMTACGGACEFFWNAVKLRIVIVIITLRY